MADVRELGGAFEFRVAALEALKPKKKPAPRRKPPSADYPPELNNAMSFAIADSGLKSQMFVDALRQHDAIAPLNIPKSAKTKTQFLGRVCQHLDRATVEQAIKDTVATAGLHR